MNDRDDSDVDRFCSRLTAVTTEVMEIDNKPFKFVLLFEVKVFQSYTCMYK